MRWTLLAATIALPGGFLLLGLAWWHRRQLAREQAAIDRLIKPARPIFVALDEDMRERAARRREHVDAKRLEAARIASGQPVDERFKIHRGGR